MFFLDLESPWGPLLGEEYIEGAPYNKFKEIDDKKIDAALKLIKKISQIKLTPNVFPFKFKSINYQANIKTWRDRLREISQYEKEVKKAKQFVKAAAAITRRASQILLANEKFLKKAKPEFIYNDIHGGNIFWRKNKAIFIDWQKVSLGDPAFMLAVFSLAFEKKTKKSRREFFREVIKKYTGGKPKKDFIKLFWLRILEREVSNMIWVVWAATKQNKKIPYSRLGAYDRFIRTKQLVKNFSV